MENKLIQMRFSNKDKTLSLCRYNLIKDINLYREKKLNNEECMYSEDVLVNILACHDEKFVNEILDKYIPSKDTVYNQEEFNKITLENFLKAKSVRIVNNVIKKLITHYHEKRYNDDSFLIQKGKKNINSLFEDLHHRKLNNKEMSLLSWICSDKLKPEDIEDDILYGFYYYNEKFIKDNLLLNDSLIRNDFFENLIEDENVLYYYMPYLLLLKDCKSEYSYEINKVLSTCLENKLKYERTFENRIWGINQLSLNPSKSNKDLRLIIVSNIRDLLYVDVVIYNLTYTLVSSTMLRFLVVSRKIDLEEIMYKTEIVL